MCYVLRVRELSGNRFTFRASRRFAWAGGVVLLNLDGHDDVVALLVEFEDELHVGNFVGNAKIDGSGGAEKIHCLEGIGIPRINVSEVQTGFLLLKEYSHIAAL